MPVVQYRNAAWRKGEAIDRMMSKLIFVNPQWQGGGDTITYDGAREIESLYLKQCEFIEVPTSLSTGLQTEYGILGYSAIRQQTALALGLLERNSCSQIFAVGGGCDADVPVIAYLNKVYDGKLLVLWFDAHGDLNAPSESQTGLFYGMPARILMGDCAWFSDLVERPLTPRQIVQIGGRSFDDAEKRYIKQKGIPHFTHLSIEKIRTLLDERPDWYVYIHLDLDVLNPSEFPNTPLPVEGGLSKDDVRGLLCEIKQNYPFAGLGLYEYSPCGKRDDFLQFIVDLMGT